MAKKIIKNHQESVEKANETKTNSSPKHSNDKCNCFLFIRYITKNIFSKNS